MAERLRAPPPNSSSDLFKGVVVTLVSLKPFYTFGAEKKFTDVQIIYRNYRR